MILFFSQTNSLRTKFTFKSQVLLEIFFKYYIDHSFIKSCWTLFIVRAIFRGHIHVICKKSFFAFLKLSKTPNLASTHLEHQAQVKHSNRKISKYSFTSFNSFKCIFISLIIKLCLFYAYLHSVSSCFVAFRFIN